MLFIGGVFNEITTKTNLAIFNCYLCSQWSTPLYSKNNKEVAQFSI